MPKPTYRLPENDEEWLNVRSVLESLAASIYSAVQDDDDPDAADKLGKRLSDDEWSIVAAALGPQRPRKARPEQPEAEPWRRLADSSEAAWYDEIEGKTHHGR